MEPSLQSISTDLAGEERRIETQKPKECVGEKRVKEAEHEKTKLLEL